MSNEPGPAPPVIHPAEPTHPTFTGNWQPTPDGKTHGIAQGDDIVIHNSAGPDYMFYGILEQKNSGGTYNVFSVTWDGFNDGPKDGVLVIHTLKSVTGKLSDGTPIQVDVPLPKGQYRLVLRDDPTPNGEILGESDDFVIY